GWRRVVIVSGWGRTLRPASAVWAALIVPLFATIAAPPAAAQIVAGPGQSVTVPPNTIITCTNCVALETQGPPGGTITTAPGPFTLNVTDTGAFTAGANVLFGTGGVIRLDNGTIKNIAPLGGGVGATPVFAQTGLIPPTNVTTT